MGKNSKGIAHLFITVFLILIVGGIVYYTYRSWRIRITTQQKSSLSLTPVSETDFIVDFSECQKGKRYQQSYGLGSNSLEIKKSTNKFCEVEFTNEVEGGFSTYYCKVPKTFPPIVFPATEPITKYCEKTKSGNVFLQK